MQRQMFIDEPYITRGEIPPTPVPWWQKYGPAGTIVIALVAILGLGITFFNLGLVPIRDKMEGIEKEIGRVRDSVTKNAENHTAHLNIHVERRD